jgi:hypothetical protein
MHNLRGDLARAVRTHVTVTGRTVRFMHWLGALLCLSFGQSSLDSIGITSTMKDSKHYDLSVLYREIDSVRKPSEQAATKLFVNLLPLLWVMRNLTET